MTTKELFDEYANIIYNLRVDPKYHYCATGRTLEGIIQEVEALVRKEVVEEIYSMRHTYDTMDTKSSCENYAQSKGIIL